jgi:hypothetical protein
LKPSRARFSSIVTTYRTAPLFERMSASGPSATTRPFETMIARAQAASTSFRLWVDRRTVWFFPISWM